MIDTRTHSLFLRRITLVTSLAVAACSSSGGSSNEAVTIERFPVEMGAAFCNRIYTCCTEAERMKSLFVGNTEAECRSSLAFFLQLFGPGLQDSVAKGRIAYHPDRASACLATLKATSCEQLRKTSVGFDTTAECRAALEPRVAIGGQCGGSADCVKGWCEGAVNGNLGKCMALKADGQACEDDDECTNGGCNAEVCGQPVAGEDALCE